MDYLIFGTIVTAVLTFALGVKIVRPTQRALVERLGKYHHFANPGFNWIIPFIDNIVYVDVTEKLVEADKQTIITKDRLNANVDAQVYFKVKSDEKSVKDSQYNVQNYGYQIVQLARSTLRNIIGSMTYEEANSGREEINLQLQSILSKEASPWGIEIVRTELKEIDPPEDVQKSMNQVIKAENDKKAAIDFATAKETQADGEKRAAIKSSEGIAQGRIIIAKAEAERIEIEAKAQAESIKLVNEAANKYFVGNAKELKRLEVTENSLKDNAKIILTEKGVSPQLIIGNLPIEEAKKK